MSSPEKKVRAKSNIAFLIASGLLLAALCLLLPRYFPLMEPDSAGYVNFSANRTAIYPYFLRALNMLGLGYGNIIYVQVALFCFSVMVLSGALLRWGVSRIWVLAFVIAVGANAYFTSFQRTLLTESISFSALIVSTAFLVDYLRTGRTLFFIVAGFFVGLTIGIRPAGLAVAPMLLIAPLLLRNRRNVAVPVLALAVLVPAILGWLPERLLYRAEFGNRSETITPYILTGKAAMVISPNAAFSGPHASALQTLAQQLETSYLPVHAFIAALPSWVYWPVMSAFYEAAGQFQVIDRDLAHLAAEQQTTPEALRSELGRQTILGNLPGYFRLTSINYLGQWSIGARTFPPAARAVTQYTENTAQIPLHALMTDFPFKPEPNWMSYLVYPGFIAAGLLTLVLSFWLIRYLIWPAEPDSSRHRNLMAACFFAVLCHSSMLVTSLVNVSTPRFLMMVYPHILLSILFLLAALLPARVTTQPGAAA